MSASRTEYAAGHITAAADAEAWRTLFGRIESMIAEREAQSPMRLTCVHLWRDGAAVRVDGSLKTYRPDQRR